MITFAAELRARRRQGAGPRAAPRRPGAGGDLWRAQGPGDGLARGARAAPPARQSALLQYAVQPAGEWRDGPRAAARRAAAPGHRRSDPRRLRARLGGRHGRGRDPGGVRQRGDLARPQARRRAEHRPPRGRAGLPGRCDPGRDHGRPRGVRHRRQRPHQPRRHCRKARGRRSPIATSRSPRSPRPRWWRRRRRQPRWSRRNRRRPTPSPRPRAAASRLPARSPPAT